jgi:hypothetical protein
VRARRLFAFLDIALVEPPQIIIQPLSAARINLFKEF